jgi:L-rhamnose mutarotase
MYSCGTAPYEGEEESLANTIDFVYTCNLVNDLDSIARYKHYHSKEGIWSEVRKTFEESGAIRVKIYLKQTLLMMIVSLPEGLTWEEFSERYANAYPEKIKEWGEQMAPFQVPPSFAEQGEIWVRMDQIFDFKMTPKQH